MSSLSHSVGCNICYKLLKLSVTEQKLELLEFPDQNKKFDHFLRHFDLEKYRLVLEQNELELTRKFRCCYPKESFDFQEFQPHCYPAPTENQEKKIPDKIWCKLCRTVFKGPKIKSNERHVGRRLWAWKDQHVMKYHLKENVFQCKHCSYGFRRDKCLEMKIHIRARHQEKLPDDYIDNRPLMRPKIYQFKIDCFGYSKKSIFPASSKKVPETERQGIWCNLCKSNFKALLKRNLYRWRHKHVIDNHLRKTTFACYYCEYENSAVESNTIKRHIKRHHKSKLVHYKNLFKSLRPEIDELGAKCFGTPPMARSITQTEKGKGIRCAVCQSDFLPPSPANRQNLYLWQTRHILSKHLDRPIFECAYCPKFLKNNTDSHVMKNHVRKEHKNKKMQFRSNLSAVRPEIEKWRNDCFCEK